VRLLSDELKGSSLVSCDFVSVERRLSETKPDVVFLPLNCTYPADAMDALVAYLADGGTIVDMGGYSMYQPCHWKKTGEMTLTDGGGAEDRARLRFEVKSVYADPRYHENVKSHTTDALEKPGTGFYTQWTLVEFLKGGVGAGMLEKAWKAQRRDYPKGFHWMRCFENHDFANVLQGEKRKEALYGTAINDTMIATCFLMDGVPMLYNGQEIADASPHSIFANRDHGGWCIDWSRASDEVATRRRALVKDLAARRHAHPALFDAPLVWLPTDVPEKAYAFRRVLPEGDVTLVVNIAREPVSVTVEGKRIDLPPQGFRILCRAKK